MKYNKFSKEKGTFGFIFTNKDLSKTYMPFIQFSFMNPWILPKFRKRDRSGSWMFGWLFFYFGVTVVC